jgi:hypothetical protein
LHEYSDDCYIATGILDQISWSVKGAETEQFSLLVVSGQDTLWKSDKLYAAHRLSDKVVVDKKFNYPIKVFMKRDMEEPKYTISVYVITIIK